MPWSTVKNLVLMVVIIAIVLVILFKVPGLADKIFGWLGNQFGGIETTEGKILHVRTDPSDSKVIDIFEFHLTDLDKNGQVISERGISVFYPDTSLPLYKSNCILLTTSERQGPITFLRNHIDEGFIYYISPGSRIPTEESDKSCTSLNDCLSDYILESGCKYMNANLVNDEVPGSTSCTCSGGDKDSYDCPNKFGYVIESNFWNWHFEDVDPAKCPPYSDTNYCSLTQDAFNAEFRDFGSTGTMPSCSDNPTLCNLLVSQASGNGRIWAYQINYGLICDASGNWQACTEDRAKEPSPDHVDLGAGDCTCTELSDGKYDWEGDGCTATPTTKSLTLSAEYSSAPANGAFPVHIEIILPDTKPGVVISLSTDLGTLSVTSCTTDETGGCRDEYGYSTVTIASSSEGVATITGSASEYTSGSTTVTFKSFTQDPTICDMTFEGKKATAGDGWCQQPIRSVLNRVCNGPFEFAVGGLTYSFTCHHDSKHWTNVCECTPETASTFVN